MTPTAEAVLHAALALPPDDRAVLADRLLDSLTPEDHRQVEAAWATEAERRLEAIERGEMKLIPGEEVFQSLRLGKKP